MLIIFDKDGTIVCNSSGKKGPPNHIGEIQLALHDPAQRWFYYPAMRPDEVLMFKTFDSIDEGRQPCSIHTAIHLADAPADARPRESVETRAFVFYR